MKERKQSGPQLVVLLSLLACSSSLLACAPKPSAFISACFVGVWT